MTELKTTKLTRGVKIFVDVIFYLLAGVCIFLVVWIAVSPLIVKARDASITASVPVAIGAGAEPRFEVEVGGPAAQGVRYAFVDEAQGTLRLETSNWGFIAISNLAKLLTAIGLAYVFYLLRGVLQSILQGEPFSEENARRVRRMGYAVLLVAFLRPTVEYLAAYTILKQLAIVQPALSLPSPFQAELLLTSLLILILAQVWSYGLELELERALTV